MNPSPRPFVKWAGGKALHIERLLPLFPKRIHTYFEPFLGGGAVFYTMASLGRFERAVLNDYNQDLVEVYKVVRDFPDDLMTALFAIEEVYPSDPKGTYEAWKNPSTKLGPIERAARFVFLNKAGFNGLFRVNKRGQFNVPWGKRPKVKTYDAGNLLACSQALNKMVALRHGDFVPALSEAREGDLVYFDPPYVPLTPTASFTTYTSDGFTLQDQQRLALLFRDLYERDVPAVMSNSDTEVVRDLYAGFEMYEFAAKRAINSKGDKRGPVGELIIVSRRGYSSSPSISQRY